MLLTVLVTAAMFASVPMQSEPTFDGKPLGHWIQLCFDSTDTKLMAQGESAILKIGAPAVPALLTVLADRGDPPRRTTTARRSLAASVLGKIGAPARSALPALRELLKDPDFLVRASAADAIKAIDVKKD
ncbi:MAG: HEAT repeat domain-containing protein [Acidobacteriota bacterium]